MLNDGAATTTPSDASFAFDAEPGGNYRPDLYIAGSIAECITVDQALSGAARDHYLEHGWLAVRTVFGTDEVRKALAAMNDLIRGRINGFKGVIYEREARSAILQMTDDERYDAVRKLFRFVQHEPRMSALAGQGNLAGICRNLLGASPELFQDMALLKPPLIGREKPWHQDHAFFNYPIETKFVGVWIALDPSTLQNGCMHVLDKGHRLGPQIHFKRRDFQICDADMLGKRAVAFPLNPGDAMFFDGLLPHGTPSNSSPDRRRALQFHYAPPGAAELNSEIRLQFFGAEGKDATC